MVERNTGKQARLKLQDLPFDTLETILCYLTVHDQISLQLTCHGFKDLFWRPGWFVPTEFRILDSTTPSVVTKVVNVWGGGVRERRSVIFDLSANVDVLLESLTELLAVAQTLRSITLRVDISGLDKTFIHPAIVRFILGCRSLAALELDAAGLRSSDILHMLSSCEYLTELALGCSVEKLTVVFERLARLHFLKVLRLRCVTELSVGDVTLVARQNRLQHLEMYGCRAVSGDLLVMRIACHCTELISFSLEDQDLELPTPVALRFLLQCNSKMEQVVFATNKQNQREDFWRDYRTICDEKAAVNIAILSASGAIRPRWPYRFPSGFYKADVNRFKSVLLKREQLEWARRPRTPGFTSEMSVLDSGEDLVGLMCSLGLAQIRRPPISTPSGKHVCSLTLV